MRRLTISSRPGLSVECFERPDDDDPLWIVVPLVFFLLAIVGDFLLLLMCCCGLGFTATLLGDTELIISAIAVGLVVLGTARGVNSGWTPRGAMLTIESLASGFTALFSILMLLLALAMRCSVDERLLKE